MVGDEGLGRSTARYRVQHRGFNFQKPRVNHHLTHGADRFATRSKGLARLLGHDEVNVALTITQLLIGNAMKLIGQGAQRFR